MKTGGTEVVKESGHDWVGRFDALNVSSKFAICGLPIRVDTYKTCSFGCRYCFANGRKIMEFGKTLALGDMGKLEREREFAHWPKFTEQWIRTFQRMVDKRIADGLPTDWTDGTQVFDFWLEDKR